MSKVAVVYWSGTGNTGSFLYLFFSGICQCKKTNSFYTLVVKDFLFIRYDSG